MRLGQGNLRKTPILAWAIFVGAVSLVSPDAACVGAQEVVDFSKPRAELVGTIKNSRATDHHERYWRVPVLGEVTSGGPATAIDPPTDAEVMHALKRVRRQKSSLGFDENQREGVRIIKEKIADFVDPLRTYPLIGAAQLHHAHYKCTIQFTEETSNNLPDKAGDQISVEVVYIDHNHFHIPRNSGNRR